MLYINYFNRVIFFKNKFLQTAVSCNILVLFANWSFQNINFYFTCFTCKLFGCNKNSLVLIKGIKQPDCKAA